MTGAVASGGASAVVDLEIFCPSFCGWLRAPPLSAHGAGPFLLSILTLAPPGMTAGLITRRSRFLGEAMSREDMNQLNTHAIAKRARTIPMMTTSETYRNRWETKHPAEILSIFPA